MKRFLITAMLLTGAALASTQCCFAADKHPDRKPRDQYARQFAAEVEHHGWEMSAYAMSPGCGKLCFNHGNHDCLRLVWNGGTVEAVDRFQAQELQPRMQQLRDLGFVEIDILGLFPSNSYPYGAAQLPIR